jgi:hypothetical protein
MLANVIVHYDSLDHVYRGVCLDGKQPLWIRHAARRGMGVLNKYYGKSDESHLYRLALCKYHLFLNRLVVLHLRFSDAPIDACPIPQGGRMGGGMDRGWREPRRIMLARALQARGCCHRPFGHAFSLWL